MHCTYSLVRRVLVLAAAFALASMACLAQVEIPIRHTLRFPEAKHHYVHVESSYPTGGASELEVYMAVWTPGSYLVREYARNIDRVEAFDTNGNALPVRKSRKNRWTVQTQGASAVRLRYPVYCREMSVRTNFVDQTFAMLQGAATYLTLVGQDNRPHEVTVELPAQWNRAISGMRETAAGRQPVFYADDFDTLVDSPIVAGNPDVFEFEVQGKQHFLVNTPASDLWDGPKSVAAVKKVVEEYARMWRGLPYEKYVFFNMLVEAGGGLEHKNSTVMMTSAWNTRNDDLLYGNPNATPPRGGWISLVSHEFFHVWNVKRLRPASLGPFDYERENYSESLWIAEGITSYYDELALKRAGIIDRDNYLARLSRVIENLQSRPGRFVQSAHESSYDAWIKGYRPDENSVNTGISYYTKGNIIGFLLDGRIRMATNDERSLDDVMRLAYQRYSGQRGYTPEDFRDCVKEVAGPDVTAWLETAESTSTDYVYEEVMGHYGLRFRPLPKPDESKPGRAWLGAETKTSGPSVIISGLRRGTPAYRAGLNVDDEILAIAERRITASVWERLSEYYKPGDRVELLVSRRGTLHEIPVTFGSQPRASWKIEVVAKPSDAQRASLAAWLESSSIQQTP